MRQRLNEDRRQAIAKASGAQSPDALAKRILGCGFDPARYLDQNPDLRQAGLRETDAVTHFLLHGHAEDREPLLGPLPDGLLALRSTRGLAPAYRRRLVRSAFLGQLRNEATQDRLWARVDAELIAFLRDHGGVPYFVFGDSHARLFHRSAQDGDRWLAPLALVAHGASALGLGSPRSRSATGPRILQWAATWPSGLARVPVLLAFGGLDAEFRWVARMIEDGATAHSQAAFAAYARASVNSYGRFLRALGGTIGPGWLRVCSVVPSALADAHWVQAFAKAYGGPGAAAALAGMRLPGLAARTELRRTYNAMLAKLCAEAGLAFVDAFTPLLGRDGCLDPAYLGAAAGRDFHVDLAAAEAPVTELIWRAMEPPA